MNKYCVPPRIDIELIQIVINMSTHNTFMTNIFEGSTTGSVTAGRPYNEEYKNYRTVYYSCYKFV